MLRPIANACLHDLIFLFLPFWNSFITLLTFLSVHDFFELLTGILLGKQI
jgi:hypothetical protein